MKFISRQTGAILEPHSPVVAEQMAKSPAYIPYVEKPAAKKPTPAKTGGK